MHKIGEHEEGPLQTSIAADYIKPWIDDDAVEDASESEDEKRAAGTIAWSGRPSVGK